MFLLRIVNFIVMFINSSTWWIFCGMWAIPLFWTFCVNFVQIYSNFCYRVGFYGDDICYPFYWWFIFLHLWPMAKNFRFKCMIVLLLLVVYVVDLFYELIEILFFVFISICVMIIDKASTADRWLYCSIFKF